jgi:hypothetical protein
LDDDDDDDEDDDDADDIADIDDRLERTEEIDDDRDHEPLAGSVAAFISAPFARPFLERRLDADVLE